MFQCNKCGLCCMHINESGIDDGLNRGDGVWRKGMFVRAIDKKRNQYYKSMVYGVINSGYYEQAILFNPLSSCFELIDYLDKETKNLTPLYECINNNREEWVSYQNAYLLKLKKYFKENKEKFSIKCIQGYPEFVDDFAFIYKMISNKKVSLSDSTLKVKSNEDENEWNYIRTQSDANDFMKLFVGFHDSTLDKILYEENYGKKQLNIIFDNSGWFGIVELCFEGLSRMNLQPFVENYSREIYDATFRVIDETVYWADGETTPDNFQFNGTWIKALNCKWKKVE